MTGRCGVKTLCNSERLVASLMVARGRPRAVSYNNFAYSCVAMYTSLQKCQIVINFFFPEIELLFELISFHVYF